MLFTNKVFFPKNKKELWYLARALKNRKRQLINGFKLRFASKIANTPAEAVAIQYILDNKHVSSAIFGTTQQKNIERNIESLNIKVNPEVFVRIKETRLPYPK